MRTARLVAAVVTAVLACLGTVATAGVAAGPDAGRTLACKQAPGKHRVCVSGKEIGDTNNFVAFGKVPTYKGRVIKLQRRVCGSCAWKFYKSTRTTETTGWFRTRIYPGGIGSKVCYRVVVPRAGQYATTRVVVGCITTTKA